ncbi:activator-dependent family glycosyltransferase [Streptomyces sp. AK010]|uniref:activator-dependent family glycosyltransferase n=1 Tax=Streptomyces sp. AK010 TaxID=2723074 RepID=UPI00161F8DC5|nr:activator-dependent family glycosyltransferase [Streptomyces sp. AK010]MBB6421387.1 glycosyltransferase (activator-dependent family) [Streptomyces sp. AK010]
MRVLFVTNPEKTISRYLVSPAWALRTAGHDVRFAAQPGFADVITGAGLTAVPVGSNRNQMRIARMAPEQLEAQRAGLPEPYDVLDHPDRASWEYLRSGMEVSLRDWHKMENFPIIADLVEFARSWQPDLVIWEPTAYAGAIAAKAVGAAHARILFGIDVFGGVRRRYLELKAQQPPSEQADPLADWLAGYGRTYGFDFTEDMLTGHFTIDQFPASLQTEAPGLHYLRMRYVPYGGRAIVPDWLRDPPKRPRVALTMGLSATEIFDGYTISLQDILTALADLDIDIVATVADNERKHLTHIPDNAHLVPYVPWHALVPTCSAVIHHAGAATLATTSLTPVPQLALHYHFDQPILARKLADTGAGLAIHTSQATGPAVRHAVQRLLTEPHFHQAATRLTHEITTLPSPNDAVAMLESLVERRRNRTERAA